MRPSARHVLCAGARLAPIFAVLALACLGGGARRSAAQVPQVRPAAERLPAPRELPDFSLKDQGGRPFTRKSLEGHVWVFDFVFTHCSGPCPIMGSRMGDVQKELAGNKRVRLASVTVDPERDSPEVLSKYAALLGAEPSRWVFLTGQKEAIYGLARKGFLLGVEPNDPAQAAAGTVGMPILHSTRFVLVDGRGRIRGYYEGTDASAVARLVADAGTLEAEALQ